MDDVNIFYSYLPVGAPASGEEFGNVDFAVDRFASTVNRPFVNIPLSVRDGRDLFRNRRGR
jgi:hypothetical protein